VSQQSTPTDAAAFRRRLLAWYRRAARDLPWRRTRDPYRVLVSEFMLQQTQVARVLEFYPRFLRRYPSLRSLARARPAAVREAWDGLGYYRRAANLHRLAREVVVRHGGVLPDAPEDLERLPGVGPYTAGAVAAFAHERPVAAVDTNVGRVLRRVFGCRTVKDTRALGQRLQPRKGRTAWAFNQALMELGALVCTARSPKCAQCPVRRGCGWYLASGDGE
jgi:A/G-specific adenine glycosylase